MALRLASGVQANLGDCAAREMLQHAARNVPELRSGGALLACSNKDDGLRLRRIGFDETGTSGVLAFTCVRSSMEMCSASHVALHVGRIEDCTSFFSLLGYAPTSTFMSNGARCAWLASQWSNLALELIEVPQLERRTSARPNATEVSPVLGLTHMCLDVTPLCTELTSLLDLLQARSLERFGRKIHVLTAPHQQMMGSLVAEVTLVRAPDGVRLELMRRAARLKHTMELDWAG